MAKLFASDFDGTLKCGTISERTREAIRHFRAQGGVFGIVTGRAAQGAGDIFGEIEADFVSCANGAVLVLPDGRREVFARYGADTVRRLWEMALSLGSLGLGPQAEKDFVWISTDGAEREEQLRCFLEEHASVCQCNMLFHDYESAAHATRLIAAELGFAVNPLQNGCSVDIPPRGIDKAFGVRRAAEYFAIDEDMIYTAGNEMNDYSMVAAFHGFAMSGSPGELTAAAERVIGDVADALEAE